MFHVSGTQMKTLIRLNLMFNISQGVVLVQRTSVKIGYVNVKKRIDFVGQVADVNSAKISVLQMTQQQVTVNPVPVGKTLNLMIQILILILKKISNVMKLISKMSQKLTVKTVYHAMKRLMILILSRYTCIFPLKCILLYLTHSFEQMCILKRGMKFIYFCV